MREQIAVFRSVYETLKMLPEESRGEYVMGILGLAFDDEDPGFDDPMLKIAWVNTRPNVEQAIAYEERRLKLKENGKKGGRPRRKNQAENQSENQSNNQSENQSKNQTENQGQNQAEKQEKEKEEEVKSLERAFYIPQRETGAGAAMAAPVSIDFDLNAEGASACLEALRSS